MTPVVEGGRIPPVVDLTRAHDARVYDYLLGGSHNFAVDRALANQAIAAMPQVREIALANRSFLRRVVRACVRAGVRQFLDLGSGIPGSGNVHDVAQGIDPTCRVAYVDVDPVALAHGRLILAGSQGVALVNADLLDPSSVLHHPEVREVLDFDQPIAVLLLLVLHLVPDGHDPDGVLAEYRAALPEGSMLALTHPTPDQGTEGFDEATRVFQERMTDIAVRGYDRFADFFTGFDLVEPGITTVDRWRPEHDGAACVPMYGGLGVKRR
jgi:SAM-dependent methyltransferase